jgi:hypothetical protein
MGPKPYEKKLTAILSADAEGCSRLAGEDENATIRTLTTDRETRPTGIQHQFEDGVREIYC